MIANLCTIDLLRHVHSSRIHLYCHYGMHISHGYILHPCASLLLEFPVISHSFYDQIKSKVELLLDHFRHNMDASIINEESLVISLDAPNTSPDTPPKLLLEILRRTKAIIIAAPRA